MQFSSEIQRKAVEMDGTTEELERTIRELKDRQDIYDCLVRYCHGVDKLDRELVRSAYHDDAIDDHGDFVGPVEGFLDWAFNYHITLQKRTVHAIHTHSCEIDGDVAHCETYWTFTAVNQDAPHQTRATGRYLDRMERRAGRWAIVERICVLTGLDHQTDPDGVAGDAAFVPSRRDGTDPAYMRPLTVDRTRFTQQSA